MSDLITMCVQEEERMRAEKKDFVNQVGSPRNKRKFQEDFNSKKKLYFTTKHDKTLFLLLLLLLSLKNLRMKDITFATRRITTRKTVLVS